MLGIAVVGVVPPWAEATVLVLAHDARVAAAVPDARPLKVLRVMVGGNVSPPHVVPLRKRTVEGSAWIEVLRLSHVIPFPARLHRQERTQGDGGAEAVAVRARAVVVHHPRLLASLTPAQGGRVGGG